MNRRINETAGTRLARLLTVVPWLSANDGVTIAEAASHFGVSEKQFQDDLWLLICTGTPGHLHGDLVDIQFWDEDGSIHVLDAQTLDRPLRPEQAILGLRKELSLFANLRLTRTGTPVRFSADMPLLQVQPPPGPAPAPGTLAGSGHRARSRLQQ